MTDQKTASGPAAPALRTSITDVELLAAFRNGTIKIYVYKYTSKKDNSVNYGQELRYVATDTPVLTRDNSYIDTTGTIMFGPFSLDDRQKFAKSSKYPKKGGDDSDEAKVTFGTKTSGTFGELMLRINDVEFPAALSDFVKRSASEIAPGAVNKAFSFCKKRLGSSDHPVKPEDEAKYQAAQDWRFSIPYRFKKIENPQTKEKHWGAHMFRVVEYHLSADGQGAEEVDVPTTRENVHTVLARNTVVNVQLGLGNLTRQSAADDIAIYFPSFNANITIIVEKPAPRGERKTNVAPDKQLEMARRLKSSAGFAPAGASSAPAPISTTNDNAASEPYCGTPPPPPSPEQRASGGSPSGNPSSSADLASALAGVRDM
jgi:hypothetical protein